jgi:hypothetical protein
VGTGGGSETPWGRGHIETNACETSAKKKKKTTLGRVVNGGRRHAEQQGELIPRGYTRKKIRKKTASADTFS